MAELFPPTLAEMIAEVEREIKMRRQVYPNQVIAKRLTQVTAERRIQVMQAIVDYMKANQ